MRKRSKYKPKSVLTDPLSILRPASKDQRDKIMLNFLTSLQEITSGRHPGIDEWRSMSDAINTLETLAALGKIDSCEVMPIVNAAIAGMVSAADRYKAGKGMRLDASGLEALRDVVAIYGQCLEIFTEREMAIAQQETQKRVSLALAGKTQGHHFVSL